MASYIFFIFSLLFLTTTAINTTTTTTTKTTYKSAQLNTIIDAIISAGDFTNWAKLLSTADISTVPLSATVFVPLSSAGNYPSPANNNPLLLPYHIVPRRLSFSQLQLFPTGARLPTIIPGGNLLITNNSAINFTLNGGAMVTKPDLFHNDVVYVHGVDGFLGHIDLRTPPPHAADHKISAGHPRRKPTVVDAQPRPPVIVSAGVTTSFWCGKVVMVGLMILLIIHILGNFSL